MDSEHPQRQRPHGYAGPLQWLHEDSNRLEHPDLSSQLQALGLSPARQLVDQPLVADFDGTVPEARRAGPPVTLLLAIDASFMIGSYIDLLAVPLCSALERGAAALSLCRSPARRARSINRSRTHHHNNTTGVQNKEISNALPPALMAPEPQVQRRGHIYAENDKGVLQRLG